MTGLNCDKVIDEDYDFHFYDPILSAAAALSVPFKFTSSAFTISLWVKFDVPLTRGTVLTLYNSRFDICISIYYNYLIVSFKSYYLSTCYLSIFTD